MRKTVGAGAALQCVLLLPLLSGALAASHGGSLYVETKLVSISVARPDLEAWTARTLLQDDETPKHEDEVVAALQLALNRTTIRPPPLEAEERCRLSKGDWCTQYMLQDPTPRYPPKYYDKPCPRNCSGVGQCNHEYGICFCPAGWGGEDCSQPRKRPCKHMGPDKRDLGWLAHKDWAHTRCAGICDDDIAMCYCPPETKFGHQPAPAGSAPGTPPAKRGRPLFMCNPNADKDGNKVEWGGTPYADIFGPDGWCNSEKPTFSCPCRLDGLWGPLCDQPLEQTCANQCSGHGECNAGFCKCHEGWYGSDCGRHRGGPSYEPGDQLVLKPWMAEAMTHVIATEDPPLTPSRRRPYIYVYDMKPDYSTDYWQYRIEAAHCIYRSFQAHNRSAFVGYNAYAVEPLLHELFLTSEHRTLDPEEADFFYAPISMGCLFDVYGWNDVPRWPADLHAPRTHGAAAMQREAARWLNATLPWFARRGGRDHIWLTPHDEGACAVWKEVWPGIMLTHWGRTDFPHFSGTEYGSDNYSKPITHAYHPGNWLDHTSRAHPCFDPKKDLVIPAFKHPGNYKASPYLGGPAPKRDIFAFFMGDMRQNPGQDPHCLYSRCIRQAMLNISRAENWREKHNIMYGDRKDIKGDYSELLGRSTFCFVLPGDGWSPRLEDAVLHGCIPVIIMDDVQAVFETVLDFSQFSLRIAQKDIPRVVEILKAVPQDKVTSMQAAIHKVWHRFRYMGLKMLNTEAKKVVAAHSEAHHDNAAPTHPGVEYATVAQDDAFSTIVQWLHSRIPDVQGTPAWAYKPKPQLQGAASGDKAEAR